MRASFTQAVCKVSYIFAKASPCHLHAQLVLAVWKFVRHHLGCSLKCCMPLGTNIYCVDFHWRYYSSILFAATGPSRENTLVLPFLITIFHFRSYWHEQVKPQGAAFVSRALESLLRKFPADSSRMLADGGVIGQVNHHFRV